MDFGSAADWTQVYQQSFEAQMLPLYPKQHVPLPDVVLSSDFNKRVIAVETFSTTAKSTWRLGVRIHPFISISGLFDLSTGYYLTELGKTSLVLVRDISSDYKVRISIPKWFLDISIKVWKYENEEAIPEELQNLENQLSSMQTNIGTLQYTTNRIESKIDALDDWGTG